MYRLFSLLVLAAALFLLLVFLDLDQPLFEFVRQVSAMLASVRA